MIYTPRSDKEIEMEGLVKSFTKENGDVELLKACVLSLNRLLVSKGIINTDELYDSLIEEIKKRR
jgi:hypothetical protein